MMREGRIMINFEKIKAMSVDEMAEWLDLSNNQDRDDWSSIGCFHCINHGTHHHNERECGDCEWWGGIKAWLQKEAR